MYAFGKYLKILNTRVLLHTLVWLALIGLPYLFHSPSEQGLDVSGLPTNFFPVTNILHAALFYLNAYWVQPRLFNKGRRWQYTVATLILIALFFYLKVLLFQFGIFSVPLEDAQLPTLFFPTVMFILISIVYRMVIDRINMDNEQLKTELKFLRSQVSPHFLFNVLNNMVSLARQKSDQLEPSLIKLAGLMRYMLLESADQQVSLAKEVAYLESYIELQKIRYSDEIEIKTHFSEAPGKLKIEPMLLIPFVENAFKHGVGLLGDPKINVSLAVNDDILSFEVINRFNKNERGDQKDISSGIGLKNVKKRLDILYPAHHQLKVTHLDNTFKINLEITLR